MICTIIKYYNGDNTQKLMDRRRLRYKDEVTREIGESEKRGYTWNWG
jgi:hypothetical protein